MSTEPSQRKSFLPAGVNLNSILLLIVIILLAVAAFKPAPEYSYRVIRVAASDVSVTWENEEDATMRKHGKHCGLGSLSLYEATKKYTLEHAEYVGMLCPDGSDAAWIVLRTPKK